MRDLCSCRRRLALRAGRLSAYWLGASPETFYRLYTGAAVVLFLLRWLTYRTKGCGAFCPACPWCWNYTAGGPDDIAPADMLSPPCLPLASPASRPHAADCADVPADRDCRAGPLASRPAAAVWGRIRGYPTLP